MNLPYCYLYVLQQPLKAGNDFMACHTKLYDVRSAISGREVPVQVDDMKSEFAQIAKPQLLSLIRFLSNSAYIAYKYNQIVNLDV